MTKARAGSRAAPRKPSAETPPAHAGRGGAPLTHARWAPFALGALVCALGADVFRLGFFGDDFHMLDVARRMPFLKLLGGEFGIYPWYRPLAREAYFALLTLAGEREVWLARLLSLGCVAGVAWQVRALVLRWADARVAGFAAALFAAHGTTKFLTAWASGFQDLLALLLTLTAMRLHASRRLAGALALAFLAVFAKETAFVVFPLLALHTGLERAERAAAREWLAQAGTALLALALHAAVRMSWHSGGRQVDIVRSLPDLGGALLGVATGFANGLRTPEPLTVIWAVLAMLAVAWLAASTQAGVAREPAVAREAARRKGARIAAAGAGLGVLPLLAGHALGVTTASSYYAFAAVPWIAMLAGGALGRLPRPAGNALTVALVGWNALALGWRPPDLQRPEAWEFRAWDWPEAVRLSAISHRLGEDLRTHLAGRPESTVVLYYQVPEGSFFQSEDGPATRESLRDRTMRSYWLNAPPFGLTAGRFEILGLDLASRRLVPYRLRVEERIQLAASSVAAGEAATAWAYANHGHPDENRRFEFAYYRAAAALMAEGPAAMQRALADAGLADTSDAGLERLASLAVGPAEPLHGAMRRVLRHPLDADAHRELAVACREARAMFFEAVELRISTTLDPRLTAERLRLATVLLERGKPAAAQRDLAALVTDARGTPIGREAAAVLKAAQAGANP